MSTNRPILTIGTFDGVHRGHAALIERARARAAAAGSPIIALVFDPSPASLLRPAMAPARLTTFEDRRAMLLAAGVDEVERLTPTPELLGLPPEDFIRQLAARLRPCCIVEGRDFRFGRARKGDVGSLAALGESLGFSVEVVPERQVPLTDHTLVPARSSIVRWLLSEGRVRDAAAVLGRWHALSGEVAPGDRRGRTLGIRTANFVPAQMVPADGVYAGIAALPDGRSYPAAVHVGERPTFAGAGRTVEAHLIDAPATPEGRIDGLDEYGWGIRLELVSWVRGQVRFPSVDELVEQMRIDVARCLGLANASVDGGAAGQSSTPPARAHRAAAEQR